MDGQVIKNVGHRVTEENKISYKGKMIRIKVKKIYLLMNKPKNVITSVNDERGRRTVLDLVRNKIKERIYPVGRLDRNTTGLLLLTNDGELAQKLTHPSFETKKIYHVYLNSALKKRDLATIRKGVKLEDGVATVDKIDYVKDASKTEIGIEIHSGKNRIIRRLFEYVGYEVVRLDRVYFAGLTKKDLPRGRFRHLDEKEIIMLKHFA